MVKHQQARAAPASIDLSPMLVRALRIVTVAGEEFEPFCAHLIDTRHLRRLIAMGLVEQGTSKRPAVGPIGYRLSAQGWAVIDLVWYPPTFDLGAARPAPLPPTVNGPAQRSASRRKGGMTPAI
jgi:hypothetical protein